MAITKKDSVNIEIKPIDIQTVTVRIKGTSPLIMHKWSEKASARLVGTQRFGCFPEWPNGADCKSAVFRLRWFESISTHSQEMFLRK